MHHWLTATGDERTQESCEIEKRKQSSSISCDGSCGRRGQEGVASVGVCSLPLGLPDFRRRRGRSAEYGVDWERRARLASLEARPRHVAVRWQTRQDVTEWNGMEWNGTKSPMRAHDVDKIIHSFF
jgi:hypothetical protein